MVLRTRTSLIVGVICAMAFQIVSVVPAAAAAETTKAPVETAKAPAQTVGYDISYPQCGKALPSKPAFGIVGVNGGLAYSENPCLKTEYTWALSSTSTAQQPRVSFYANTGNPGPISSHWPTNRADAPQPCDGSWNAACAYDYGWFAAQDSFNRASAAAGSPGAVIAAPWWLDVELANSWSNDTATNSADLQGAIAYLKSQGVSSIGIYAATSHWATIIGASTPSAAQNEPFRSLPNWLPGARTAKEAAQRCTSTLTGGPTRLTQYLSGSFDADYACP